MKTAILALAALSLVSALAPAAGQQPAPQEQAMPAAASAPKPATLGLFVYPAAEQDAAQQATDENECFAWARQQTGIDPTAPPKAAKVPDTPRGGAVRGAARGAAKGAVVGEISDDRHVGDAGSADAGEGAAVGAAAGAARGRRAQKKAEKQAEAQAQQAAKTQDAQAKETFKKAWGACLEGRKYSVK